MECIFEKLDKQKQEIIINASLHIFSEHDFKHALTDDIAFEAQISKGSLFQYFKNKISLYIYLYNFSLKELDKKVREQFDFQEKDFFNLVQQSLSFKISLYKEYPYLYRFIIKANEETNPEVIEQITEINQSTTNHYLGQIYKDIDYSKFKEGVDVVNLLKMIDWCGNGIYNEGLSSKSSIEDMYQQALKTIDFFKQAVYKQEHLK